jgi:hypothetical protein
LLPSPDNVCAWEKTLYSQFLNPVGHDHDVTMITSCHRPVTTATAAFVTAAGIAQLLPQLLLLRCCCCCECAAAATIVQLLPLLLLRHNHCHTGTITAAVVELPLQLLLPTATAIVLPLQYHC